MSGGFVGARRKNNALNAETWVLCCSCGKRRWLERVGKASVYLLIFLILLQIDTMAALFLHE